MSGSIYCGDRESRASDLVLLSVRRERARERERQRERERDYQERYFVMRTVSIVPPPVLKGVQQKLGVSSWFPFPFMS